MDFNLQDVHIENKNHRETELILPRGVAHIVSINFSANYITIYYMVGYENRVYTKTIKKRDLIGGYRLVID